MVPISVVYESNLRCIATHDNSGVRFITDAPKDNFGKGESFSPTDLVATALGTCMITTIGIKMRNDRINIDGTHIAIEKHMSTDLPRRITKLVAILSLPNGIEQNKRKTLEEIAHNCPVVKSLHPDIELDIQFRYSK